MAPLPRQGQQHPAGVSEDGGTVDHTHSISWVKAKAASCGEAGNISHYACSACGECFEDQAGTKQIADKTAVILSKLDHPIEWERNKTSHRKVVTCEHTDTVYPSEAHTMNAQKKCTVCGYPIDTEGLVYEWSDALNGYVLSGIGTATGHIVVGSIYEGKPVVGIAARACYLSGGRVETMAIPKSVTSIGSAAFWNCTSLKEITIPDSVTNTDDWTFCGCISLEEITIPKSVTRIGWEAFYGCTSLASIDYQGKVVEWNAIAKDKDWDADTGAYTVYCTDGNISK